VLDIATGSGDIPIALDRLARRQGLSLAIEACDVSVRALAVARSRGTGVRFFELDAIKDQIPGDYDVVISSLFMHHLDADDVVALLYKMRAAAARMVLVSDLARSPMGMRMAWAATRLFSRSRVVRTDAILSVRAAFTVGEFGALAEEAGLIGASIRACWPCRFLLEWRRA
jgi:SAM-dependent methyltransferase